MTEAERQYMLAELKRMREVMLTTTDPDVVERECALLEKFEKLMAGGMTHQ